MKYRVDIFLWNLISFLDVLWILLKKIEYKNGHENQVKCEGSNGHSNDLTNGQANGHANGHSNGYLIQKENLNNTNKGTEQPDNTVTTIFKCVYFLIFEIKLFDF